MLLKWLCVHILLLHLKKADSSRILAIGPIPSYSHQIVFQKIWRELSLRGHEVVLLTVNPIGDPNLTNLTEIDLSFSYDIKEEQNIAASINGKDNGFATIQKFTEFLFVLTSKQLEHQEVQKFLSDDSQHFDLVMFEFLGTAFAAFAYKYKCPSIGLLSLEINTEIYSLLGSPQHPAIYPNFVFSFYKDLTFTERLKSTLFQIFLEVFLVPSMRSVDNQVIKKYFGEDYPDSTEIINNVDMVFHNVNPILKVNKPVVPALIEFGGGFHIMPLKPLPIEIKNFLDAAHRGVIYFSLGGNVRSDLVKNDLVQVILETLSSLPFSVLWKFDKVDFKVPDNVKILNWIPQQDVLRHPNIKLFISQCGLQSVEEALYSHVPVICMPFMGDQHKMANIICDLGIGIQIDSENLSVETFKEALLEVINDPKYKETMVVLDRLSKDQPMTGIEKVVWWTEYVIRNKGAKNLRSALKDMPFYQYYFVDVISFIAAVVLVVMYLLCKLVKCLRKFLYKYTKKVKKL